MSRFVRALRARAPEGLEIPEVLERAWSWMEEAGHLRGDDDSLTLTAYAGDRAVGIEFDSGLTLTGWFEDDQPGADRLLPIARTDHAGGRAALWRDPAGQLRVVHLGGDGARFVLTDDPVDLVRLVAMGHRELDDLAEPEPEPETAAAHADFRGWVVRVLGLDVPATWSFPGYRAEDTFTAWVDEQIEARGPRRPLIPVAGRPVASDDLGGEAAPLLDLIGTHDAAQRAAALLGLPDADGATLREAGVRVFSFGPEPEPPALSITLYLRGREGTFPRPAALFDGLAPEAEAVEVQALLGEPVTGSKHLLTYSWGVGDAHRLQLMIDPGHGLRSVSVVRSDLA